MYAYIINNIILRIEKNNIILRIEKDVTEISPEILPTGHIHLLLSLVAEFLLQTERKDKKESGYLTYCIF